MKLLFSILLFLFPTSVCRVILKLSRCKNLQIGRGCHIGFSVINCNKLCLSDNSHIGNFNYIKVDYFCNKGRVDHFNVIRGPITMIIEDGARIHNFNKFSCASMKFYKPIKLWIKCHAAIINSHLFDLTDSITIGEYTIFAGADSQVWTHSFILGSERHVRVDGEVVIGRKCYIGSKSVICAGVHICDNAVVGANATISKDIKDPGLYISQPIRKIEYQPDAVIGKLQNEVAKNVYSKTYIAD